VKDWAEAAEALTFGFYPRQGATYTPARAQRSPQQAVPQSWSASLVEQGQLKRELSRPPQHRTHQLRTLAGGYPTARRTACSQISRGLLHNLQQATDETATSISLDGSSLSACGRSMPTQICTREGGLLGATSGQSCTGMQPLVMTSVGRASGGERDACKAAPERNPCVEKSDE